MSPRPRLCLAVAALVAAAATTGSAAPGGDALRAEMGEGRAALATARQAAARADERARAMESRAAGYASAADRDRAARAALGLRIQAAEADLAAIRARVGLLDAARRRQRARLAEQQRPVAELLAALQLLSRRPPLSLLLQPGEARDIVHARAMIEAVLPVVRQRTAALRAEIDRGRRLAAAQRGLARDAQASARRLAARRSDLTRSEAAARVRAAALASGAGLEGDRVRALAQEAGDLGGLIDSLEEAGARRDRLARLPGPAPRPGTVVEPPRAGWFAAAPARPAFQLPVVGRVVAGFGEVSDGGTRSRGITVAAAPGAQVVAPAAGRVVYAGPFRSFGRIVIVDHGGGWTSLVTGLLTVSPRVGERVEQGSPIGRAGGARPRIGVELRRGGRPIDAGALTL